MEGEREEPVRVTDLGLSGVGSGKAVARMVAGIFEDMVEELIRQRGDVSSDLEVSIDLGAFPRRIAVTVEAASSDVRRKRRARGATRRSREGLARRPS